MAETEQSREVRNRERREKSHEADVVVVGAGVFGCAIAFALANQGRSVILLERWMHEPDRIVGELLQPGGVEALRKLGLEHTLEGIDAIPCYGYHVVYRGEEVEFAYPRVAGDGRLLVGGSASKAKQNGAANGHAIPNGKKSDDRPEGRSFHHGRFIMNLRKACLGHPNISVFETEVVATIKGENSDAVLGVETRTKNKTTGEKTPDCFFGALTIIADGYASIFRKELLGTTPIVRSKFYALELIDCPFPPAYHGHVVIGDQALALLYQIGTHETRALIDVPPNHPAAAPEAGGVRNYISTVVIPALPAHVQPYVKKALEADNRIPKSMPNSWLPARKQTHNDGVILLGDAHNMRHPLTGGGMTVAFHDAVILSDLLRPELVPDLSDHAAVRRAMGQLHWRRKQLTSIINVLAQALYSLFAADDWQLRALQKGCFRYFERGFTDEPVALLGGILKRPLVLAYNFYAVAFLAIWLNTLETCSGWGPLGILKLPLALVQAILILWKACVVFLPVFWTELR
jgi:squalene monooxygenase